MGNGTEWDNEVKPMIGTYWDHMDWIKTPKPRSSSTSQQRENLAVGGGGVVVAVVVSASVVTSCHLGVLCKCLSWGVIFNNSRALF